MTYRPSTDPAAPVNFLEQRTQAKAFLRECGMARVAPPIHAADALYKLVGPDPKRVPPALALLDLVEAVHRQRLDPIVVGEYAPGEWEITLHDDIGEDCPRFFGETLAAVVKATADALAEQEELERHDSRISSAVEGKA